ncbi:hypothetical protein EG329_013471 [Mollisiaceae sp. DMI_Dod_QoI]|nr:hypothetical protein EG329_013471 [Helotiales sp. DMI_Dod_QoI]
MGASPPTLPNQLSESGSSIKYLPRPSQFTSGPSLPSQDADSEGPESFHSNEPFLTREETNARMQYWRSKANTGGYGADTHIVDPLAHYTWLEYIERDVVENSEFFFCHGAYSLEDDTLSELSAEERKRHNIGDWIWIMRPSQYGTDIRVATDKEHQHTRLQLSSLWKSYIIICRVLLNLEHLISAEFCTSFYTLLVRHPEEDVAELFRIKYGDVVRFKTDIESRIIDIFDSQRTWKEVTLSLSKSISGVLEDLLDIMGHPRADSYPEFSLFSVLTCRMKVLILDMGLVSYVGSHGSTLTASWIASPPESPLALIEIRSFDVGFGTVTCSLQPLACLRGFIGGAGVWVFDVTRKKNNVEYVYFSTGLSILTHVTDFADTWGPIWTVPAAGGMFGRVQQYNIGRGIIRPIDDQSKSTLTNGVVRCHWSNPSFKIKDEGSSTFTNSPRSLGPDDRLLIGAALEENNNCRYTLAHYEQDYGQDMGYLGTISDRWSLDARSLGFSAGQYINLTASGTQKKVPGVTLKEAIWNQFSQSPQSASIEWLNNFIGVEISHCTGNARRVRMKDLLCTERVRKRINRCHPGWETTEWGQMFSHALDSEDFEAMRRLWQEHPHMREPIAGIIAQMLQLLHLTGNQGRCLIAAYFKDNMDKHLELDIRGNEWGMNLKDSKCSATYAIIGNICLKDSSVSSGTSCTSRLAPTMLQMRINFRRETPYPDDSVKLRSTDQLFRVDRRRGRQITLTPIGTPFGRLRLPHIYVAMEVLEDEQYGSRRERFLALFMASKASYGGMNEQRRTVNTSINPDEQGTQDQRRNARRRARIASQTEQSLAQNDVQDVPAEVRSRRRQHHQPHNQQIRRKKSPSSARSCCFL